MVPPASSPEELLAGLTPAQRAAVTSPARPLCILAAAGAGKTRVLTRRIAYRCLTGDAAAAHTLAITFTRKAAGELQHRMATLGLRETVAAGTFHSSAAAALQRWWADRGVAAPALLERKSRLLAPILAGRPAFAGVPLHEMASIIEWAKARAIGPGDFASAVVAAGRVLPAAVSADALGAVYARYEDEKRRRRVIDFDDMLLRCAEALEEDQRFADAQRWKWRHIYVDEFQDLNPLQHRLLLAWLGDSSDLCVVGDPHQAIYGWNGSDPGLLAAVPSRWPATQVVHLDENHRCTEEVVATAAAVLGPDGGRLRSAGRRGPVPTLEGHRSEDAEAAAIASGIARAARSGRPLRSMAVLARTNAQLSVVGGALSALGVAWWSAASAAVADGPGGRELLSGLSTRRRQPLSAAIADLEEMAAEPAVDDDPRGSGEHGRGPTERAEVAAALATLGRTLAALRPEATIGDWLAWLPTASRDRSGTGGPADAVTLCSFHRAKGLEWDAVWVAGVEEGLVPLGRRLSEAAEAEERRLLYVALTRAADELHITWAQTRRFGARAVPRQPSRWAADLDGVITRLGGGSSEATGSDWRRRLRADQSRLAQLRRVTADRCDRLAAETATGALSGADLPGGHGTGWTEHEQGLRTSVRAWRLEAARASGIPPHMILHDATIDAIAAAGPQSMDDLLCVPGLGPVKAARYGPVLLDLLVGRAESA